MNSNLLNFFIGNRYAGHTTLSIVGAKEYREPFYIIGATLEHATKLSREIKNPLGIPISLQSLLSSRGNDKIACLIDNYTIMTEIENLIDKNVDIVDKLLRDNREEKEYLSSKIISLNKFLSGDRKIIQELKAKNEKLTKKNEKLTNRIIKTKNRLRPTLLEISRMSLWDRIFNFNKITRKAVDDYLY